MISKLATFHFKAATKTTFTELKCANTVSEKFNCGCPISTLRTYYRTRCKVAKELSPQKDQCPELTHDKWGDTILPWCPGCPRRLTKPVSR